MLEGGTASHGNILAFPSGIKAESASVQRYRCRNILRSYNFSLLVVTSLSVSLRLITVCKDDGR